jgi:hypothetical protein
MLIRISKTCVRFTNAETIYVKPYYGLYHVLPYVVSHYYHLYVMLHAYQKLRKTVQFTNADTIYVKPYYGLHHVLSSVYQSISYSHTIALLTLNV